MMINIKLIIHFLVSVGYIIASIADVDANEAGAYHSQEQLLQHLRATDKCGTKLIAAKHGYEIESYQVKTKDGYVLELHRVVHPADRHQNGPARPMKKPYLLLHGLIGSSASFLRATSQDYQAPQVTYKLRQIINDILVHREKDYEYHWQSVADMWNGAFEGDKVNSVESMSLKRRVFKVSSRREFATINDPDVDGDTLTFGYEFKQAYRKFNLPKASKEYVTNSLALTLANFNYDVWLLNLRGNAYSRNYNGRLNFKDAMYWDFNIEKLVREDLLASINYVRQVTQFTRPMGLVAYSYSAAHVMSLLHDFPQYQASMQPVVLMAPTLMTGAGDEHHFLKFKSVLKMGLNTLIANNGPFPSLGREKSDKMTRLLCKMPVTSNLCKLTETMLHGQVKGVKDIIIDDPVNALVKKDAQCGQTSVQVLKQLVKNLESQAILPVYQPFVKAQSSIHAGKSVRRSVLIVHSDSDDVSTPQEVGKISNSAFKLMTLADVTIRTPHFSHMDFLFSKKNQFLVNGEIVRMAAVFDFLDDVPKANRVARKSSERVQF